jgi:hypothetical protein
MNETVAVNESESEAMPIPVCASDVENSVEFDAETGSPDGSADARRAASNAVL